MAWSLIFRHTWFVGWTMEFSKPVGIGILFTNLESEKVKLMLSPRALGFVLLAHCLLRFIPSLQSFSAKSNYCPWKPSCLTHHSLQDWVDGGLWSFQFWKHCVTLISLDTVFSPLSVSLIRTCSPLGRAGLCKVTSWQSVLTWKHSKDGNQLGKLERDFSGDERDKKEGCWQARIQSLVLFLLLLHSAATCQQVYENTCFFKVIPLPLDSLAIYVYLQTCILSFNYYLLDKFGNERYKVGEI